MNCPQCKVEMIFHPMSSDFMFTRFEFEEQDEVFTGILDEFYSCPDCGRTVVPHIQSKLTVHDIF